MRSLRPRKFSWYEDSMRLAEDEAIARKKRRQKQRREFIADTKRTKPRKNKSGGNK